MKLINPARVRKLNQISYSNGSVVYWMSRDQRVHDNWALLYAQELAAQHHTSLIVVFCLRPKFQYATERLVDFMVHGLEKVEQSLADKNITFNFLLGDPAIEIEKFMVLQKAGVLVSDFSPLTYNQAWKKKIIAKLKVPFHEVDAHNVVPVWTASTKQEFGAYTLRPKINKLLPVFLDEFPRLEKQPFEVKPAPMNWKHVLKSLHIDNSVPKISWAKPGEESARSTLEMFIENKLPHYESYRNDPTKNFQSNLSPYLHFGHIASQRIAMEVLKAEVKESSKEAFLDEVLIRKELSDNFCFYNKDYESFEGFPAWAKKTLNEHRDDPRDHVYTLDQFKLAQTDDSLWNAAQNEMVNTGKMHGYMRMYWAKKIFEWTYTVQHAQQIAIELNDTFSLDGRDPNGYAGIAWSMGGVHDRAWFERPIFGKIRYMNANGAKRKFDVNAYISQNSQNFLT